MTQTEALRLALEALKQSQSAIASGMRHEEITAMNMTDRAIFAIKKAALEAKDEPVAWMRTSGTGSSVVTEELLVEMPEMRWNFQKPLYTTPPQRKPLTDEEIKIIWRDIDGSDGMLIRFARAIEAGHGIKGEA